MTAETFPGLSSQEAAHRLGRDGANELAASKRHTLLESAAAVAREPMSLLLLSCGGIYLVLGDTQESLMLLGFVVFIMGITLVQERKTERALEALRDMASPRALVIRDGQQVRISGRDVVMGDLLVLAEGDRVPADATILSSSHLLVDESLLSGESVPVRKTPWDGKLAVARPGGDDLPFVYAGTLVVEGSAVARVHATGSRSEMGFIGQELKETTSEQTILQRETQALVTRLAWISGALSLLVVVFVGVLRHRWLQGVLAGITLAMAILPNEFPVVVTIFLAMGAWRLSRHRVLTRRIPAIEAIGSATVLCVDKTGTLTMNRMTVEELAVGEETFRVERLATEDLPEAFHQTVEFSILASRRDPFDPMERAFKELGERYLAGTEHLHPGWTLLREYPLTRELLAVTQVWRAPAERSLVAAMKGAPEAVADLCHLSPEAWKDVEVAVEKLAAEGMRVLAVGKGALPDGPLPERAHDLDFTFVGLVGLADPVREDVPRAIAECHAAGIRVVMITGDYPATAIAVARRIGIDPANVHARVLPEQKLALVQALKAKGDIVAMTGDGVNDAPALKAASIGVAMGGRGTDVAREAATLVLLDDDFASLVRAVRHGRRIIDNLKKALAYILAVHLPIVGLTLVPIFAGWPLVLMPIHVAFLHLVIDPACSIVFEAEPEEAEIMRRPPRPPEAPLFSQRSLLLSLAQGAMVTLVVVAVYGIALHRGVGELESRALTFTTFMVANLGLIFTNRSWSRTAFGTMRSANRALWWVTAGAVLFLGLVLYLPGLRELFRFAPLDAGDVAVCVAAGAFSVTWFEVFKLFVRRRARAPLGLASLVGLVGLMGLGGLLTGCASAPPVPSHHLSAAQYDERADREQREEAAQLAQFNPTERTPHQECSAALGGADATCWTSETNPTEDHLRAVERLRAREAEDRAASQALRDAEARACAGIPEKDRDVSPFDYKEDIVIVEPLIEGRLLGAAVFFRRVPGMSEGSLQRQIDCHLARNGARGHVVPQMPGCPLVPQSVTARVTAVGGGFRVDVRSEDPESAREVARRGMALVR